MNSDQSLYEVYFQKSSPYYLDKLEKFNKGQKYTFNVYAFLFGIFWYFYRKMYLESLLIIGIFLLFSLAELIFIPLLKQDIVRTLDFFVTFITAGISGSLANYLYLKKANREIKAAINRGEEAESLKKEIKQKGGVTYWFLIILVAAMVFLFFYNNYYNAG